MRRKTTILILSICTIICIICYYKQTKIEVISTQIMSSGNCMTLDLTIVLNTFTQPDCQKSAKEIVNHCIKNDFENIILSYDKGVPTELTAKVYLTQKDFQKGICYYEMNYRLKENSEKCIYNIIENPDKYILKIKKR